MLQVKRVADSLHFKILHYPHLPPTTLVQQLHHHRIEFFKCLLDSFSFCQWWLKNFFQLKKLNGIFLLMFFSCLFHGNKNSSSSKNTRNAIRSSSLISSALYCVMLCFGRAQAVGAENSFRSLTRRSHHRFIISFVRHISPSSSFCVSLFRFIIVKCSLGDAIQLSFVDLAISARKKHKSTKSWSNNLHANSVFFIIFIVYLFRSLWCCSSSIFFSSTSSSNRRLGVYTF